MLLTGGSLLLSDPGAFVMMMGAIAGALLVGITAHEFGHALVAYRLGDMTAALQGRLSLNPRAHLDPAGTMMLLLVGFGWGKPVPVNLAVLRYGRRGMALVSVAGPLANLFIAGLFALPFQMGILTIPALWPPTSFDPSALPAYMATMGVVLNLVLAVFNLLPFAPLDGSNILLGIAPRRLLPAVIRLQVMGPGLLIFVILLDFTMGIGILWRAIGPVVNWGTVALLGWTI